MLVRRGVEQYASTGSIRGSREHVWIGPWRGIVTDNTDKLGRLKVQIPELTVAAAHPILAWPQNAPMGGGKSDADGAYGSLFLPPKGAAVWVEFMDGDPDFPVWLPGWFGDGEVPDLLKTHWPNRRGIVYPKGSYQYFDSDDGSDADSGQMEIGVSDQGNPAQVSTITVTKKGKITIKSKQGILAVWDPDAGELHLGSETAMQPVPNGDDLHNRLTTLETAYAAHGHDFVGMGAVEAVNPPFTTAGTPNIKNAKVRVGQ